MTGYKCHTFDYIMIMRRSESTLVVCDKLEAGSGSAIITDIVSIVSFHYYYRGRGHQIFQQVLCFPSLIWQIMCTALKPFINPFAAMNFAFLTQFLPKAMQSQEKAKLTKSAAVEIFVSRETNRLKVGFQAGKYTTCCK